MRYLSLEEVIALHRMLIAQSGGSDGLRDPKTLDSAVAQPRMTFGGEDLYPTLIEKAAALGFSLVMNHAFIDGNKRIGHAAMEVFLALNGFEISASVDEQERVILDLAAGLLKRDAFIEWLRTHVVARGRLSDM
ncbi:type II toxin-antitoxin system death-on-curing family toxin [Tautonia marina]|uniref:type II toxin-antitoxin system death-on-curing family toxin n=1 Tax=Tautonia marina TaxID=2653855 RepID=UPI001260BCB4|nr:type II toxin-antitoxin system death-on-curing family toxin [Tautonia marina]